MLPFDPQGFPIVGILNLGRCAPGLNEDGTAADLSAAVALDAGVVKVADSLPGGTACRVAVRYDGAAAGSDYACWAVWRPHGAVAPVFGVEPVRPGATSVPFHLPGFASSLYDLYVEVPTAYIAAGMTALVIIDLA